MVKTRLTPASRISWHTLHWAIAQEPTGGITGSVTDPSGATVPRATVTVEEQGTGRTYSVQTADNGQFTFPRSAAGRYALKINAQGFAPYELQRIDVEIDRTRTHSCRTYDLRP